MTPHLAGGTADTVPSTDLHHVRHQTGPAEPLAGDGHGDVPLQLGPQPQRLQLRLLLHQLPLVLHRRLRQVGQQVAVLDVVAPHLLVTGHGRRGGVTEAVLEKVLKILSSKHQLPVRRVLPTVGAPLGQLVASGALVSRCPVSPI